MVQEILKNKIVKNKDIPKCFDYSDYWIEKEKYTSVLQYVKNDKYVCKCFLYLGLQVKKNYRKTPWESK